MGVRAARTTDQEDALTESLVWFRRDLRVGDLPTLSAAGERALGLFVLDDRLLGPSGGPRRDFLYRSLSALDEQLAAEVPDVTPAGSPPDERPTRHTGGQIDGTPEDGDSFFTVVDDDEHQVVPGDDEADAIIED